MSRSNDVPSPAPNPFEGFGQMFDSLEGVNQAWRTMHMHSPFKPTLDIGELDKRIQELRTVEQWLSLNLTLLRNTIQAMEVQRGTLEALKQMSASFSSMTASATGSRSPGMSAAGGAPAATPGLWPGLAAWHGMASPGGENRTSTTGAAEAGSGGLPGMGALPGLPGFGAFPGMSGAQPFGGMPWIPGLGEAPGIGALFGGTSVPPTEPGDHPAAAAANAEKDSTPPEPAPSATTDTTTAPDSQAGPRHYTPPGWAAATGTDGWQAAVSAAPSPEAPPANPEGPAATASRQLAQAWWQLMQQQLSQMAAQAERQPGESSPAPDEAGSASSSHADTEQMPSARQAPQNATTPASSRNHRKKQPPARDGSA
ncbi:MAG: hypothetical protein Q4B17_09620 [Lautropia sp.]|nr:hypothetical protein [Lautropia sp.]